MKTMHKRIFLFTALVLITTLCMCINVSAEIVAEGSCGDNATWTLDNQGILTISGSGKMTDYNEDPSGDWHSNNIDSIQKIIVQDGITHIGDHAFAYCRKVTSITLPNSLTSIGAGAFRNTNIPSISLPQHVTSIGAAAFSGCSNLSNITFPDSITVINKNMLSYCISLSSVHLPGNLQKISTFAFEATAIKSISIPDQVTNIDNFAFYLCGSLVNITLPDNLTNIGNRAFYGCSKLPSISIPGKAKIGTGAFSGCSSLKDIQVSSANAYYTIKDGVLFTKSMKTLVQFPLGRSIQTYSIPDETVIIGDYAFSRDNHLQAISIPINVQSIGNSAFEDCSALQTVYYAGSKDDKEMINIGTDNDSLNKAKWIYGTTTIETPPEQQPTENICLSKPKSVKLTAVSAKKIKVSWKKLSAKDKKKIKKIQIEVSTDKQFTKIVKKKIVSSGKTSWTIPGLKKNTKYYVRIRAYTKSGNELKVSKWVVKSKKTKKK